MKTLLAIAVLTTCMFGCAADEADIAYVEVYDDPIDASIDVEVHMPDQTMTEQPNPNKLDAGSD